MMGTNNRFHRGMRAHDGRRRMLGTEKWISDFDILKDQFQVMTRMSLPELDSWAKGVGRITDDHGGGAWNEETEFN